MRPCANGSGLNHATSVCLTSPPPLLLVEVSLNTEPAVIPCAELTIKGTNKVEHYTLVAIIYLGGFHFTARMVDCEGTIWSYDGQQNNGSPWFNNKCGSVWNETDLATLLMFQGHPEHLYIYSCTTWQNLIMSILVTSLLTSIFTTKPSLDLTLSRHWWWHCGTIPWSCPNTKMSGFRSTICPAHQWMTSRLWHILLQSSQIPSLPMKWFALFKMKLTLPHCRCSMDIWCTCLYQMMKP